MKKLLSVLTVVAFLLPATFVFAQGQKNNSRSRGYRPANPYHYRQAPNYGQRRGYGGRGYMMDRDRDRGRNNRRWGDRDRGRGFGRGHDGYHRGNMYRFRHGGMYRNYRYRGFYHRHDWDRYYREHRHEFRHGYYHRDIYGNQLFSFQGPAGNWFSFGIGN